MPVPVALLTGASFDGDITFELTSGLGVRVANDQYALPHIDIDRNGSLISDDSTREVMFDCFGDYSPVLGRIFLTAAYLLVDHDAGTFTLWEASPTNETDLVEIKRAAAADGLAGNGGSVTAPPDGPAPKGVAAGTVAGAVVGGLAVLAVLAAALWWFLQRRKSARQQAARPVFLGDTGKPELPSSYSLDSQQPKAYGGQWRPELGGVQMPAEVADSRQQVHEVPGDFAPSGRHDLA